MSNAVIAARARLIEQMSREQTVTIHGFHGRFEEAAVKSLVADGSWKVIKQVREGFWASKRKGKGQVYHANCPKITYGVNK
jgi:hypothetical protein